MDKVTIGTILRDRIAEKGMKQEEFAEITGISISSLKKYMNGERSYTYDKLDMFANILECSYDYLLGKSLSPKNEKHDVKQQTRLSDKSLDIICSCAKGYDTNKESKQVIDVINIIMESEELFAFLLFYISATKEQMRDEKFASSKVQKDLLKLLYGDSCSKISFDYDTTYALKLRWLLSEERKNYLRYINNKTQFK